jgi:rhodanese-related sulfurtransferase
MARVAGVFLFSALFIFLMDFPKYYIFRIFEL